MATERDDDRVRGEVSPGGTEGGRRPTGDPWGGWGGAVDPEPTLDGVPETGSGTLLPGHKGALDIAAVYAVMLKSIIREEGNEVY